MAYNTALEIRQCYGLEIGLELQLLKLKCKYYGRMCKNRLSTTARKNMVGVRVNTNTGKVRSPNIDLGSDSFMMANLTVCVIRARTSNCIYFSPLLCLQWLLPSQ